jgi:hypothetical protein
MTFDTPAGGPNLTLGKIMENNSFKTTGTHMNSSRDSSVRKRTLNKIECEIESTSYQMNRVDGLTNDQLTIEKDLPKYSFDIVSLWTDDQVQLTSSKPKQRDD